MTARWDYWNGPDEKDRRVVYAKEFKPEYQAAGDDLQRRISAAQTAFRAETNIELPGGYASGWRPGKVNELTSNAAKLSTHLTAHAGDPRDTVDGSFAWWCKRNLHVLEVHALWMEDPVATVVRAWVLAKEQGREPTPWSHLQSLPPRSNLRCYWPDEKAPEEWAAFLALGGVEGMTHAAWLALTQRGVAATEEERL